jgi:nucleoside diphosphate kinase
MLLCLLTALGLAAPPPLDASVVRRQRVVAALKRFDQLEAMSSRGDPEGCSLALAELEALDEAGLAFELGGNAHNRAMRVCAGDLDVVERLYAELEECGQADDASLEALASIRLDHDRVSEAASAVATLLVPALEPRRSKSGRALPLRKVPLRTVRVALATLAACTAAGLRDEDLHEAPLLWARLGELGLWAPPPPPPAPERTLALLKPDCLAAGTEGEVLSCIEAHGFAILRQRRWRMNAEESADFLATSWGSASGDRQRRFFTEMVAFYTSGEVLALLLEKEGAIGEWRQLLGPGDPAVARGYTDRLGRVHRPKAAESVRARWGSNKQANAAHGSDSPESADREISFVFGEGWSEPQGVQ